MASAAGSMLSADEIVRRLELAPHPEGGYYRETFRDSASVAEGRAASTAIYYLLRAGDVSRWHRVDATEIWHWYAGAALELRLFPEVGPLTGLVLGPDLATGARPQAVVEAGVWQSAKSLGNFTLVGCTVAPGFEFAGFELAPAGFEPA